MPTKSEIAFIRSLASKKGRAASGMFVAEGTKLVGEILASDFPVRKLFVRGRTLPPAADRVETEAVSDKEMERISLLKTPTDALALVDIPRYALPRDPGGDALALLLDDVQDPGNLGTIVRSADWFGVRDIFCSPASADCFNPKVVQATMGAVLRVRVHYTDPVALLVRATATGVPVYGTFLDGENIYSAELSATGILVMGNEGNGIGSAVADRVSRRLYIPPYPSAVPTSESLNVAVATAVAVAEFRRRSYRPARYGSSR